MKIIKYLAFLISINLFAQNEFVVIVPTYNNINYYKKNLDSIVNQTYKNFRVIVIDDFSTDGTGQALENYITELKLQNKIQLIKNKERKLALQNFYYAIHSCKPHEIVVCIDGDDWLANNNVLEYLNKVYEDQNVWLTYGQYIEYPNNAPGGSHQLPQWVIDQNAYRKYDWVTSHLRTFKAALFCKIKKEDLFYQGQFYPMTGDVAMMLPMIEMAGNHCKFIPQILYVYNRETQLNDNKVNKELQCKLYTNLRSQKPYEKLNELNINKKFVIVIPSYNNAKYYKENLDSIFNQKYNNFRVIYIDDNSSDMTANLVEKYIKENNLQNKITLIKNQYRQLALANIYRAVISCDDDEIVVLVDGDDKLAHKNVLNILNKYYKNNVWFTHGSFTYQSSGADCGYDPRTPQNLAKENKFREFKHCLIHLRTFYAWLFKQIKIEDLFYKDSFFKMTYDVAIFMPIMEMANERHRFISERLYIYNDTNIINDHKVNMDLQHFLNNYIRQKNKYSRLETEKIDFLDKFNGMVPDIITPAIAASALKNIFDNNNDYIMFVDDQFKNYKIDMNKLIKDLELTQASALHITYTLQDIRTDYAQIMEDTYAFRQESSIPYNGVLFRKKDIKLKRYSQSYDKDRICLVRYVHDKN